MLMNNFLSSFALIGFCKEKKRHSGGPRGFLFTNTSLLRLLRAEAGACVCVSNFLCDPVSACYFQELEE